MRGNELAKPCGALELEPEGVEVVRTEAKGPNEENHQNDLAAGSSRGQPRSRPEGQGMACPGALVVPGNGMPWGPGGAWPLVHALQNEVQV